MTGRRPPTVLEVVLLCAFAALVGAAIGHTLTLLGY